MINDLHTWKCQRKKSPLSNTKYVNFVLLIDKSQPKIILCKLHEWDRKGSQYMFYPFAWHHSDLIPSPQLKCCMTGWLQATILPAILSAKVSGWHIVLLLPILISQILPASWSFCLTAWLPDGCLTACLTASVLQCSTEATGQSDYWSSVGCWVADKMGRTTK